MTDQSTDAYKVLQVDPEAEDEVIQAAYRRLAQKYHPDVTGPAPESAVRMTAINAAYETLRDPAKRRAYDRERRAAGRTGNASTDEPTPAPSPATSPGQPASARRAAGPPAGSAPRQQADDTVSSGDWTSGRSSQGGGYDPAVMGAKDGFGAAGRPPGDPSGSVLNFGRYAGWSLGEIARRDLDYVEWLDRSSIGRQYREEIDGILRRTGRRKGAAAEAQERRGLFRRR